MLDEFRSTNITWDKATSRIYSPVTANASDENGRKLVVQVVNSGQVEDLTGATLHLYWITRDKAHDGLDVFDVVDLKKGEFELSYTTGMLSNQGVLNANLVLIDTVGRVVSERFKITVTEGIDNDAIQSENSFSSLTQALIDVSNLEQNYTPRLNDLTAQLQQTEAQLDSFVVEQSSGMTDTGSLELVQSRTNTEGMIFPVVTRRIGYIEQLLSTKYTNKVGSIDLVGIFPTTAAWTDVDNGSLETLCPAITTTTYPNQRYRINTINGHKYLFTVKIKGVTITNTSFNVTARYGDTAITQTSYPFGFLKEFTKTEPFDYEQIAMVVTHSNSDYTSFDFTISLTQPNKDTVWAYKDVEVVDVTGLTDTEIQSILNDGYVQYGLPVLKNESILNIPTTTSALTNDSLFITPKFKGKNILAIGDSLTAALKWQLKVAELQGCTITTHALGGIGLIPMVDGTTGLNALTSTQVTGKDLIILFGGMNERSTAYGTIGDVYPTNETLHGKLQYVINKLYDLLATAGNTTCKILIVTPYCAGKYSWIASDGYAEHPIGSGQTLELLATHLKTVGNYNNLPVVDLWHKSGIGKRTWDVFASMSTPENTTYTKYERDSSGAIIGVEPLVYVNGTSYWQMVGGVPTFVQYTGSAPYPYYNDQLHLNDTGYAKIGELIASEMNMI